jgi:hypothetical protein
LGKGQGTEGRSDFCQETAQDVSRCDRSNSSGSKGSLGKVAKAAEENGLADYPRVMSSFRIMLSVFALP